MDDETRARIEALEMAAIDLLAARYSRHDLATLIARDESCLATRRTVSALHGWAWSDAAWRWRQRLLRLALALADAD